MIDKKIKELLTGIVLLIVGLNFIGFGVVQNGGNYRGNPIWSFVQTFWQAQAFVFFTILGLGLLFFIIKVCATDETPGDQNILREPPMMKAVTPEPIKLDDKPALTASPIIIIKPEPAPLPPPTAAELKRKALRQLTGKDF